MMRSRSSGLLPITTSHGSLYRHESHSLLRLRRRSGGASDIQRLLTYGGLLLLLVGSVYSIVRVSSMHSSAAAGGPIDDFVMNDELLDSARFGSAAGAAGLYEPYNGHAYEAHDVVHHANVQQQQHKHKQHHGDPHHHQAAVRHAANAGDHRQRHQHAIHGVHDLHDHGHADLDRRSAMEEQQQQHWEHAPHLPHDDPHGQHRQHEQQHDAYGGSGDLGAESHQQHAEVAAQVTAHLAQQQLAQLEEVEQQHLQGLQHLEEQQHLQGLQHLEEQQHLQGLQHLEEQQHGGSGGDGSGGAHAHSHLDPAVMEAVAAHIAEQQALPQRSGPSLYAANLSAVDIHGKEIHTGDLEGKVTVVVNVASHCGYTESNYNGLQRLYERYHNFGLEILAFPCNQFGQQEPDSHAAIEQFVGERFGVKFPLMSKVEVNGASQHPVFAWLKANTPVEAAGHHQGEDIAWNFEKFLLDKHGHPVKRYTSELVYHDIELDVYNELIKY